MQKMKHLQKFNEKSNVDKVSKKDEIENFIDKNKKNKSSYEMYKTLREKGFVEKDLKDYFYDNY
jgi:tRNA splicing endonuclease